MCRQRVGRAVRLSTTWKAQSQPQTHHALHLCLLGVQLGLEILQFLLVLASTGPLLRGESEAACRVARQACEGETPMARSRRPQHWRRARTASSCACRAAASASRLMRSAACWASISALSLARKASTSAASAGWCVRDVGSLPQVSALWQQRTVRDGVRANRGLRHCPRLTGGQHGGQQGEANDRDQGNHHDAGALPQQHPPTSHPSAWQPRVHNCTTHVCGSLVAMAARNTGLLASLWPDCPGTAKVLTEGWGKAWSAAFPGLSVEPWVHCRCKEPGHESAGGG